MKYWLYILCLISAVPLFNLSAQIDHFSIDYRMTPPEIDGHLQDWNWKNSTPFNLVHRNGQKGALVSVLFNWDEHFLYAALQVEDQHILNQYKGHENPLAFLNDGVEIYLDILNDSRDKMDKNDFQFLLTAIGECTIFQGNERQIPDSSILVPKFNDRSVMLFKHASTYEGTVNYNFDKDSFYAIEIAIPWLGIGIEPTSNYRFKVDICVNDMDSLHDLSEADKMLLDSAFMSEDSILFSVLDEMGFDGFQFSSWNGMHNFGFPDQWVTATLEGGPTLIVNWARQETRAFIISLTIILAGLLSFIIYLLWKNYKLRKLPRRDDLKNHPLLGWVENKTFDSELKNTQDHFIVNKAREIINSNIDRSFRPENLARELAMSLRKLQRIFKENLETTPSNFITMIKLEQAAKLLRKGEKNVNEVAYALGFNEASYFSKVFKKYYQISPVEFMHQRRA